MRHIHSNPDSEQEHEQRPSASQASDSAIPVHMPSQADLPGRQGTTLRRKLAQKIASRIGNKAFQRQYIQREEEQDERPDLVYPPAFSNNLASASLHADNTRSNAEQVQQSAQEYAAITAQLIGVDGIKEIPDELVALGGKIKTGVDTIPETNKNTKSALEAAKAAFAAAQSK